MIKLIATDMDGTLLDSQGNMDDEIYDIIEKLKEMGIRFVAASGRQLMSLKKRFVPVDDVIERCAAEAAAEGVTMTQHALRWALAQPGVVSALVGVKREEQIDEAAGAVR